MPATRADEMKHFTRQCSLASMATLHDCVSLMMTRSRIIRLCKLSWRWDEKKMPLNHRERSRRRVNRSKRVTQDELSCLTSRDAPVALVNNVSNERMTRENYLRCTLSHLVTGPREQFYSPANERSRMNMNKSRRRRSRERRMSGGTLQSCERWAALANAMCLFYFNLLFLSPSGLTLCWSNETIDQEALLSRANGEYFVWCSRHPFVRFFLSARCSSSSSSPSSLTCIGHNSRATLM